MKQQEPDLDTSPIHTWDYYLFVCPLIWIVRKLTKILRFLINRVKENKNGIQHTKKA